MNKIIIINKRPRPTKRKQKIANKEGGFNPRRYTNRIRCGQHQTISIVIINLELKNKENTTD